jgi:hypothetical protein
MKTQYTRFTPNIFLYYAITWHDIVRLLHGKQRTPVIEADGSGTEHKWWRIVSVFICFVMTWELESQCDCVEVFIVTRHHNYIISLHDVTKAEVHLDDMFVLFVQTINSHDSLISKSIWKPSYLLGGGEVMT